MFRLSKKALYAIEAVLDIAYHASAKPVQSQEITRRQGIPRRYLEQALQQLVREGILVGVRGPRGGYRLALPSTVISVADVIQAIDGPVMVTACSDEVADCDQYSKCSVRDPLWRIKDRIVSALSACTIFEMATDTISDAIFPAAVAKRPTAATLASTADQ